MTRGKMRTRFGNGRSGATAACCLLILAAGVVSGCREEEQGRPLRYDKGNYLGPEDQRIDPSVEDALRSRGMRQSFN